jgi:DNA (cytosine-5)-methyltransferase 1
MPAFYEFFAGGGMARAGLGPRWECLLANDIDAKKAASYAANWGGERLRVADVAALTTAGVPGRADLAWASFPCQDLSLAGNCAGLNGERSGTFWPFWRLVRALGAEKRAPAAVVLENVCGAISSHGGRDFAAIAAALAAAGYRYGALVIDAARFVPQSRPRLFIVAVEKRRAIPKALARAQPDALWHPANLAAAHQNLSAPAKAAWVWWSLPAPPPREAAFADAVEDQPQGVDWHTAAETRRLLALMSPVNRAKVERAKQAGRRIVGTVYRRTRRDPEGIRAQRAEVRFDGVAGCLRTPAGGSSRQSILIVEGNKVRSRLLSPREAARLMGLPDTYQLPANYNEAYHLAGDGVAVPVVRYLAEHLLEPLL